MTKISEYPEISIATVDDLLIGTSESDQSTKNFSISQINSLVNTSQGLYAQTALSTPISFAGQELSLIGPGVGSLIVPANSFKVGDSFSIKLCGPVSCGNNIGLDIRVRSNNVIILETPVFELGTCTEKTYDLILDFTIAAIGGIGVSKLFANGSFTYNKNSSNAFEGVNFRQISETVFDTTVENELDITAEWLEDSPTNNIFSQNFTLTKVY